MCLYEDGRNERIALIVGLGNPGEAYRLTRHNAGFQVLDRLARRWGISFQVSMLPASWGTGIIEGRRVSLLKPLAFMNRSGEAVSEILGYFGISAAQMLVIHDDLDLPFGRVRLVQRGGAGGHRGVTSIIEHLGHQDFPRMKLGIGRPEHGEPIEAYVLDSPYKEQEQSFERMIDQAVEAAQMVLSSGLVAAMNRFNRREPQAEDFF